MGLFSKGKKTTVKIKTDETGGVIKRFRVMIGAGVIIAVLNVLEAQFGEFLPEPMKDEVANAILKGIDLVIAWYAWKKAKPLIQAAANAQDPDEVQSIKDAAGVVEE